MLQAFHNDQKVKAKYTNRVKRHQKADEIIQGVYWENGKGCAVGCTVENDDSGKVHKMFESALGIPESLAHLEDALFEGLPNNVAKEFPLKFLNAISIGADLSKVEYQFKLWLLIDKHNGVKQWANDETKRVIDQIAELQRRAVNGDMPSGGDWSAAESAARSAAESAAWSAESAAWSAESAARSAESAAWSAESAAWSAAWSAESAAWSAAWSAESAARSAARSAHYEAMADKLVDLLSDA